MEEGKENPDYGELIDEKIDELMDAIDKGKDNVLTIAQELNEMFIEGKSKMERRNLEMLDNVLSTELQKRKEKIKDIMKELGSKLTAPSRTHLFLAGAEREAMYLERKKVEEIKSKLMKIVDFINKNFDRMVKERLTPKEEIFKGLEELDEDEKNAIKEGIETIHSVILNKLNMLEHEHPKKYSPIYKSITNFCWNGMVLYEKLESILEMGLDKYGDHLAELFEKYNRIYYHKKDEDKEALQKSRKTYEKFIEVNKSFVNKINAVLLLLDKIEEFINKKDIDEEKKIIEELKNIELLKEDIRIDDDVKIGDSEIDEDLKKRFGNLIVITNEDISTIKHNMEKFKESYNYVVELINMINEGISSEKINKVVELYSQIRKNIEEIINSYTPMLKKIEKIVENFNRVVEIHQLMYGKDLIDDGLKLEKESLPKIESKRLKDKNIELNRAAFVKEVKGLKDEINKRLKEFENTLGGKV